MRLRLGFLGDGMLSRAVREQIIRERPYDVIGIAGRQDALPEGIDLLVEAATQQAVAERVAPAIAAGQDALVLSIGALADAEVREACLRGPGTLVLTTGAIGGLDQVRALAVGGGISEVSIESRKLPATLVQEWMGVDMRAALAAGDQQVVVGEGSAAEIARLFPASANVAAAVALAAGTWNVSARMIADPGATNTRHTVRAQSPLGSVLAEMTNVPSALRPRSSAIVAPAVVRSIDTYAALRGFEISGAPILL